jgi:hypothetical protein
MYYHYFSTKIERGTPTDIFVEQRLLFECLAALGITILVPRTSEQASRHKTLHKYRESLTAHLVLDEQMRNPFSHR